MGKLSIENYLNLSSERGIWFEELSSQMSYVVLYIHSMGSLDVALICSCFFLVEYSIQLS